MTLLSNRTKMMLLTGLVCLFAAGTLSSAPLIPRPQPRRACIYGAHDETRGDSESERHDHPPFIGSRSFALEPAYERTRAGA